MKFRIRKASDCGEVVVEVVGVGTIDELKDIFIKYGTEYIRPWPIIVDFNVPGTEGVEWVPLGCLPSCYTEDIDGTITIYDEYIE